MRSGRWGVAVVSGALIGMLAVLVASCASDGADETAEAQAAAAPSTTQPPEPEPDDEEDEDEMVRTITVIGDGKVTVKPDIAIVQMGVQVSGPSAQDVLQQTNDKAATLIEALLGLGVAEEDIQTIGISIYPQYEPSGNTITGYQASNNVSVTVREIERAGEIIDGAAAFAGEAITIGGISFSVADPEAVMAGARAAAIESAKKRAGEYAEAAGVEVGAVVTISENNTGFIPFEREMAPAAADMAVPVMAGTTDLTSSVTVVFELS